jgi:16S rRNA processing protein RimM
MTDVLQLPTDRIQIGQLRAAYGLQGWLWVYSNTDPITNVFDYLPWWVETSAGWKQMSVKRWKTQGKGLVVTLTDVADRTAAEALMGATIWVAKSQLPKAGLNEFYWSELAGLTVFGTDEQGNLVNFGKIAELFETGANEVMVVRATPESVDAEERMIPWHRDVVQSVDLESGKMLVNWGVDY